MTDKQVNELLDGYSQAEQIERLRNIIFATEVERDGGDKVIANLKAELQALQSYNTKQAEKIASLEGEIADLKADNRNLNQQLKDHGIY